VPDDLLENKTNSPKTNVTPKNIHALFFLVVGDNDKDNKRKHPKHHEQSWLTKLRSK